jgi:hypothetical protein
VKPTIQVQGNIPVNDDRALEHEADKMGAMALQRASQDTTTQHLRNVASGSNQTVQGFFAGYNSGMMKSILVQHVTKYIKDIAPGKSAALEPFIAKANSSDDEGNVDEFLGEYGISTHAVDQYVTFGKIIVPTVIDDIEEEEEESPAIQEVIQAAIELGNDALASVMDSDNTGEYGKGKTISPVEQLQKCLVACKDCSPEETALYLYTTYFYQPINKLLRNPDIDVPDEVANLAQSAAALISSAIDSESASELYNLRMELKPSWIGGKKAGDTLSFPGFTSTHPDFHGVNRMWDNIESGAFGEVEDRLALLVFEGTSKSIVPGKKYFGNELETILPAGTTALITAKYTTKWAQDEDSEPWVVDVYHLNVNMENTVKTPWLLFNDGGEIREEHNSVDDDPYYFEEEENNQ